MPSLRRGNTILTTSLDHTAKLWNLQGQLLNTLDTREYGLLFGLYSPDGSIILTAGEDRVTKLWDVQGRELLSFESPSRIACAAFSPDGRLIVTSGSNEAIIWNRQGKKLRTFQAADDPINAVAFSPDGEFLLFGIRNRNKNVILRDLEGNLQQQFEGHEKEVTAVAFLPICDDCTYNNKSAILTASKDQTIKLWDWQGQEVQSFSDHAIGVTSIAISADRQTILSGGLDQTIKSRSHIEGFFANNHELNYEEYIKYAIPFDFQKIDNPSVIFEYGLSKLFPKTKESSPDLDSARLIMTFLVERFGAAYRPFLGEVYHEYAQQYFKQEEFEKAATYYQQALEENPYDLWINVKLARAWIYAGEWDKARAIYEQRIGQKWNQSWSPDFHLWDQAFYKAIERIDYGIEPRSRAVFEQAREYLLKIMSER